MSDREKDPWEELYGRSRDEEDHTPHSYEEGEVFTRDDPNHIGFGDQWRKTKAGWEFIGNAERGSALSPLSTRHFA